MSSRQVFSSDFPDDDYPERRSATWAREPAQPQHYPLISLAIMEIAGQRGGAARAAPMNGRVKPETAQQIGIVRRCVFYVIRAFDASTVFAAESKPARQRLIQPPNREEPSPGFGAIGCGSGCGLLTVR
jgi:hypothetical protein